MELGSRSAHGADLDERRALDAFCAGVRAALAACAVAVRVTGHDQWLACDGEPPRAAMAGAPWHAEAALGEGGDAIGTLVCTRPGQAWTREERGVIAAAALAVTPIVGRLATPPAAEPDADTFGLVGHSAGIRALRAAIPRAAASPFPVLVEGESGAGKELVARAVHAASRRQGRAFAAVNCAAFADELVEAELFGHARGAFTGAAIERRGLFEEAHGGTLFLDEVAELSPRAQAKLLRVLQEGEVRRLGENAPRRVDVRVVAATNRPLGAEAAAGRFRPDLRYRLDVVRLVVPPLRARRDDIPPLVAHFWATLAPHTGTRARLAPSLVDALAAYDWPGNVRELQNVVAAIAVAAPRRGLVGAEVLAGHAVAASVEAGAAADARLSLEEARRRWEAHYVEAALARCGGRPGQAARELGLSRQGLAKLLARLGVARPRCGLRQ